MCGPLLYGEWTLLLWNNKLLWNKNKLFISSYQQLVGAPVKHALSDYFGIYSEEKMSSA